MVAKPCRYIASTVGANDERRPRPSRTLRVRREGARIGAEILMRSELRRVDEDRHDHAGRVRFRQRDQRDMAGVKGAHGRHSAMVSPRARQPATAARETRRRVVWQLTMRAIGQSGAIPSGARRTRSALSGVSWHSRTQFEQRERSLCAWSLAGLRRMVRVISDAPIVRAPRKRCPMADSRDAGFRGERAAISSLAAAGKLEIHGHQAARQPARSVARLFAGRRRACLAIARRSGDAAELYDRAPNLVAVVTNGTAVLGPRRYRTARRQAGDGGQGRPVQEIRRHRRVRHRDRARTTSTGSSISIAALEPTFGGINLEDIKAPECFEVEAQAARAHEDPGVPRRPAWHRDHRRRGGAQRAGACRQDDSTTSRSSPRAPARRRLPASIFWSRSARKRENIFVTDIAGVVYEGRADAMDRWKARLCAGDRRAHAGRRHRRRRRLPRPLGRRRAEAGDG